MRAHRIPRSDALCLYITVPSQLDNFYGQVEPRKKE